VTCRIYWRNRTLGSFSCSFTPTRVATLTRCIHTRRYSSVPVDTLEKATALSTVSHQLSERVRQRMLLHSSAGVTPSSSLTVGRSASVSPRSIRATVPTPRTTAADGRDDASTVGTSALLRLSRKLEQPVALSAAESTESSAVKLQVDTTADSRHRRHHHHSRRSHRSHHGHSRSRSRSRSRSQSRGDSKSREQSGAKETGEASRKPSSPARSMTKSRIPVHKTRRRTQPQSAPAETGSGIANPGYRSDGEGSAGSGRGPMSVGELGQK